MAISLECLESKNIQLPKGRMVRVDGFDVTYFNGENFLRHLRSMKALFASFAHHEIGWSAAYANTLASAAFNVHDITMGASLSDHRTISLILDDPDKARRIPSAVLLSRPEAPGQYIAYSAQRTYYPKVEGPDKIRKVVPVIYNQLRAVTENERGNHAGRTAVTVALLLHADAKYYMHRTGNYVAGYTNTRSNYLDQEHNSPWSKEYPNNPYYYSLARSTYDLIRGDGPNMDEFGVVRGAYREPNLAIQIKSEHEGSMRIWRQMFEKYKMGPLDGIVPLYKVADHQLVAA